jgi:radical SAM protein with 4Fe4S-binding SPASM domain
MRLRHEPWGAWIMLDAEPTLVALGHDAVAALGVPPQPMREGARPPLEAHVSVTERCGAGCVGCYVDATPDGYEPSFEEVDARLESVARLGVFVVALGGGEPTTRTDLGQVIRAAKGRGLSVVVTTSGLGLRDEQLDALMDADAVNVSFDGTGEAYEDVRGFRGAAGAEATIRKLVARGVHVGINVVLTSQSLPHVVDTVLRALDLGAREVQLLRYKPSGRARSLDYYARRLTPAQVDSLGAQVQELVLLLQGRARLRIDCALVPLLSTHSAFAHAAQLQRLAVFGCEAAENLWAVRAHGAVAPCSFVEEQTGATVEDAAQDAALDRFRAWNRSPPEPCASCTLFGACKGGCKVVSAFVSREHGADPECPKVRLHLATSKAAP